MSISHIQVLQRMRERTLSLDWSYDHFHEDGPTLADLLEDQEMPPPCEQVSQQESAKTMQQQVRHALTVLTERERQVITLHFGLDTDPLESYAEIGRHLGICRERVRQLLASALEKLKHAPVLQSLVKDTMMGGWDWYGDEDNEGIAAPESVPQAERSNTQCQ